MSTPVVYGTELPIVVSDGSSTIVFGTNSIHSNSSATGVTAEGLEVTAVLDLSPYAAYAALSEPIATLLASIKDVPQFTISRTLRVGASVASFTARGEPFVQTFSGFGALRRTAGESVLTERTLLSSIPLLPDQLQKSIYSLSDELLLTF